MLEAGQTVLVNDLKKMLAEAEAGEFGDFSNQKYDAPKMELRSQFLKLADNVLDGRYD